MHKIFVYGTLLSGHHNNSILADSELLGSDTITGTLWAVSSFPGFHSIGTSDIHGEIWNVDNHTLETLDRLEGFLIQGHPNNLYNRVQVTTNISKETVWVYEWNDDVENIKTYKYDKIETGNYRDYYRKVR